MDVGFRVSKQLPLSTQLGPSEPMRKLAARLSYLKSRVFTLIVSMCRSGM